MMRAVVFLTVLSLLGLTSSAPFDRGEGIEQLYGDRGQRNDRFEERENFEEREDVRSNTWNALKKLFSPVQAWFSKLPEKTPEDITNETKTTFNSVVKWAKENPFLRAVATAIGPVKDWALDQANAMKGRTFSDMYDGAKKRVSSVDNSVGEWINERMDKE